MNLICFSHIENEKEMDKELESPDEVNTSYAEYEIIDII